MSATGPDTLAIRHHLMLVQDRICDALESADGAARFRRDEFAGERGDLARPRVLEDGAAIERAAVNFSHTVGAELPEAATRRRPELAGADYEAISVSLIVHPRNPYAPTSHANFRLFVARPRHADLAWWFGGGFDLTPYYGFREDVIHWHRQAREACAPLGPQAHARLKQWCDEYFYLKHRKECRGVGGIFFDDLDSPDFDTCWRFFRGLGDAYLAGYLPILERRKNTPHGERERTFQLMRRGRYVEFNLLYDRGTLFGLQSGGRIESILASLPPLVRWQYDYQPPAGSPEERLVCDFLTPRDWLA